MPSEITVTIVPTRSETQILVTVGPDEVMRARLLPATHIHPRATPMLLEALALWYQERVHAVVSVDADASFVTDLGLADGLGLGERTVHYEVLWVDRRELGHRGRRMRGLGDFRGVRRLLDAGRSR
jgi:hypothetical protein